MLYNQRVKPRSLSRAYAHQLTDIPSLCRKAFFLALIAAALHALPAHADGITATGTVLPVGTVDGTVLTITGGGSTGDASFTGTLEAAGNGSFGGTLKSNGVFSAPAGINVNNGGVLYPNGSATFTGNVGIGTTSIENTGISSAPSLLGLPSAVALDVYGDIVTESGHIISNYHTGPDSIKGALVLDGGPWVDATTSAGVGIYFRADNVLGQPGYAQAAYRDLMFVRADGNVGIGTDSPQAALDINGTLNVSGESTFAAKSTFSQTAYFNGCTYWAGSYSFIALNGYNNGCAAGDGGGYGAIPGGSAGYFSIISNGRILAPEVNAYSDLRKKTDVTTLTPDEGLDFIKRVNPVHFHWKSDGKDAALSDGYIAQQLLVSSYKNLVGIAPDKTMKKQTDTIDGVTVESPDNGVYTANYIGAIPYIHAALKALLTKSDATDQEIKALQEQVKQLQAQLQKEHGQ